MRRFAFSRCLHALMIFWYYSFYQCFNSHLLVPTRIRSIALLISIFSDIWRVNSIPRAFSLLVFALVEMRVYWLSPKSSLSFTTGASVFWLRSTLARRSWTNAPRSFLPQTFSQYLFNTGLFFRIKVFSNTGFGLVDFP